jgi:hypothetical protein
MKITLERKPDYFPNLLIRVDVPCCTYYGILSEYELDEMIKRFKDFVENEAVLSSCVNVKRVNA